MGNKTPPPDDQQTAVLRVIEELLDRAPDQHPVDTALVMQRMELEGEKATDEVARTMSELLVLDHIRGRQLRGDNKALDVTATGVTEKGMELLNPRAKRAR